MRARFLVSNSHVLCNRLLVLFLYFVCVISAPRLYAMQVDLQHGQNLEKRIAEVRLRLHECSRRQIALRSKPNFGFSLDSSILDHDLQAAGAQLGDAIQLVDNFNYAKAEEKLDWADQFLRSAEQIVQEDTVATPSILATSKTKKFAAPTEALAMEPPPTLRADLYSQFELTIRMRHTFGLDEIIVSRELPRTPRCELALHDYYNTYLPIRDWFITNYWDDFYLLKYEKFNAEIFALYLSVQNVASGCPLS